MIYKDGIIKWLLLGDVSIQYQVHRDLLKSDLKIQESLQKRIEKEGWGREFLSKQKKDGHWGNGFYDPKWTSTHYTLLDLKNLGLPRDNKNVRKIIEILLKTKIYKDGGINYAKTIKFSDICINGMVLNFSTYFNIITKETYSIIDYLLLHQMSDGGWNCNWYLGDKHSSLHSTLSVLEGLLEFRKTKDGYKEKEIVASEEAGREFLLQHQLFKSHRTNEIIDKKMTMLSFPSRWRYDILRALDYFRDAKVSYDKRMESAIEILLKKRRKDGLWNLQMKHPGKVHFDMEKVGEPSRWNTLRALRVLKFYNIESKEF